MAIFNPGEFVFRKGVVLSEFYAIKSGRFAIVSSTITDWDPNPRLSQDTRILKVLDTPSQTFGEIEALLEMPQEVSVIALSPAEADAISTLPIQVLDQTLLAIPATGLKVCISFARQLKKSLDLFLSLLDTQTALDHLIQNSCRTYLNLVKELEAKPATALSGKLSEAIERFKSHPMYAQSLALENLTPTKKTSSIRNCVVRPPSGKDRIQEFAEGTCICRKGTLGNRLFILTEGVVEVVFGSNSRISLAEPGTIIGEIAVLLNYDAKISDIQRTADVVCVTKVKALVVGLEEIDEFIAQHPEIITRLMHAIVERTRSTMNLIDQVRADLKERLHSRLRHCIEGHNEIGKFLLPLNKDFNFSRPFEMAAQQARTTFQRFAAIKELIQQEQQVCH